MMTVNDGEFEELTPYTGERSTTNARGGRLRGRGNPALLQSFDTLRNT